MILNSQKPHVGILTKNNYDNYNNTMISYNIDVTLN